MIRWNYVLPRLAMVAGIWLMIRFGLNPALHHTLVFWGQSVTSARVEIGAVDASLLGTQVCLRDVRIADPRRPMKNLVQAAEVSLDLEANALLQRRFIVEEGKIAGLRVETERTTSGKLDSPGYGDWNISAGKLPEVSLQWLDQLSGVLQGQMEEEIGQLESVKLVNELIQRWPAEYEQLEAGIDSLKTRMDRVRQLFGHAKETGNLFQNIDTYRTAAIELDAIRRDLAALGTQIDGLPQRVSQDRDAALAAGQRDALYIRRRIEAFSVDADSLSQYLLGGELQDRVIALADWIGWARRNLAAADSSEPARDRGLDVLFAGAGAYPDFLVRRLAVDGEAEIGRRNFQFQGVVSHLTRQPRLHGEPTVVQVALSGPVTVRMEVVVDRTGDTPRDRFVINCPRLKIPERQVGREEQFAITISPSEMHLWMSLELTGDELSGQFLLKQDSVELRPRVAANSGISLLADDLEAVLGKVQSLEIAADLNGTLDEPSWRFQSNLGPQLAEGLNQAVRRQLENHSDQLAQLASSKINQELSRLEELVLAGQEAALAKLKLGGNDLRQLSQTVTQRLPVGKQILGKRIPIELGLRF